MSSDPRSSAVDDVHADPNDPLADRPAVAAQNHAPGPPRPLSGTGVSEGRSAGGRVGAGDSAQ